MTRIGSDIEIFIQKDNQIISSLFFLGETGKVKTPTGYYERDGVPVELQPFPGTINEHKENLLSIFGKLAQHLQNKGFSYSTESFTLIDIDSLQKAGDTKALQFGCKPEFSVYLEELNKPDASQTQVRTAGGHLHIDLTPYNFKSKVWLKTEFGSIYDYKDDYSRSLGANLIQWCDLLLGMWSVLEDPEEKRRVLYGHAGSHRITSYGVEYRTLSNFYLFDEIKLDWALFLLKNAIRLSLKEKAPVEQFGQNFVIRAINNSQKKNALEIYEKMLNFIE